MMTSVIILAGLILVLVVLIIVGEKNNGKKIKEIFDIKKRIDDTIDRFNKRADEYDKWYSETPEKSTKK